MNREACKFFSGAFAAMAYAHGAYAVATASGLINEPIFLGRRWGVGYMWAEAVVYSAVSAGLGYLAWSGRTEEPQREPTASMIAGQGLQPVAAGAEPIQPASG
ncbi:hypothetical protein TUM20983_55850 [Mycobacterium antarcticum]|uniref:hypothetical protein n=1 Tax=Mycolicibacterium sp. TUM20983 TaxID=3023369 RepID=UPI00238F0C46|nr:hypothetical protein [Mycolicibacterium sp. TUM20983]GLP78475.1 hypothetical protein TUM20983_55850 [Mycolicibacterium sp. TUM20983]